MINTGELIKAFRDVLINNTEAGDRVYAWRKTPTIEDELPFINVVLPLSLLERDPSRGADKVNHRLTIIILAEGKEEANRESDADWIIDKLDQLQKEVLELVNYDYNFPTTVPGIMSMALTEIKTELKEVDRNYGIRFFDVRYSDVQQTEKAIMNLIELENKFRDKEIWIVGDGPSCPKLNPSTGVITIAINYGYKNIAIKPTILIYTDSYFRAKFNDGELSEKAEFIIGSTQYRGQLKENEFLFRPTQHRQHRLRDGIYCGKVPKGVSSGVAALSLALGMGAKLIRLFGYDYRVYNEDEAMEYFGEVKNVHASQANHRHDDIKQDSRVYTRKINSFDDFLNNRDRIVNHAVHSNLSQFNRVNFSGVV